MQVKPAVGPPKGKVMSQQEMIDAFVAECGSLEDWQGDKKEWHTAAGFFFHGWMACEKSGPTPRALDRAFVCANCGHVAIDEFCCGGCKEPKRPASNA